ncbi:MAG: GC-type dockerin domain-anchored protein [Planctomycetota bacterium]
MKPHTIAAAATILLLSALPLAAAAQGADIVVFGDSWSNRLSAPLQQTIIDEGNAGTVLLNAAFEGERADGLSSNDPNIGLPYITATLAANPNAELIHLSIGGNDLFDGVLFIGIDAIVNSIISDVVNDTETIVNHILSERPDAQIYHSGYDYLVLPLLSPARVNEVLLRLDARLIDLATTIPNYTYEGYYGWAQVNFGLPQLGLPPGDPALPNDDFQSPGFTFVDEIHYTPAVYEFFADDLYENFYRERLAAPCVADVNGDGTLTPADFTAWVVAFNMGDVAADQNGDGLVSPADFSAWISNFNAGC